MITERTKGPSSKEQYNRHKTEIGKTGASGGQKKEEKKLTKTVNRDLNMPKRNIG